jgi:hypothetical protein
MIKCKAKDTPVQALKALATAAPQALGYSLQYTRLTVMLLEAPAGTACSLEVLDDVEASAPDGRKLLVQSKSALGDNPVSDRAISLWKSLYNWLRLIEHALVNPQQTTFELYVSRKAEGKIVRSFHSAQTTEQARTALASARENLWGKRPLFQLRKSLPKDLARYANAVLSAAEESVLPMIGAAALGRPPLRQLKTPSL